MDYVPQQLYGLALPNNLNFLVKNLGLISNETVESLISGHTLYSFYKTFLMQPEAFLLKDLMRKKSGKPIFQIAKMSVAKKSGDRQILRFCSQCFKEDFQKYGEAYWHRMHQIPGMLVCLPHETALSESLIQLQQGYLDCYAADLKNCPINVDAESYGESTIQQLLVIAQEINWLLNSNFSFRGFQWLRSQYQHHLVEQGFLSIPLSKTFRFSEKKFADAIFSFYGQDCWDTIKPGLANHASQYFYRCLFACDVEPVIDRVTHILLIKFLLKSLKYFFES